MYHFFELPLQPRQLNPHQLIEGMILGSYALGARTSYIYIRGELFYVLRIIEKAIEEAYANGFLGEKAVLLKNSTKRWNPFNRKGILQVN